MKSKLIFQASAVVCILFITVTAALAQPNVPQVPGGPASAPFVPQPPTPGFEPSASPGMPAAAPMLDPATGLPLPTEPQWIDPNWSDPDLVITNLVWDNLPLSEVANQLREQFKKHFDILSMPKAFGTDWGSSIQIQLQLKQVRASDIFNAMNLVFENDRTPLRWELKANGNRPLVLLRVLPEADPEASGHARLETHRMVYFIGNLTDPEKTGGMSRDQIYKTIVESWPDELGKRDGVIQFHDEAQLLVVNGTRNQIDFIHQLLSALQEKANWERAKSKAASSKMGGSSTGSGGGSN